MVIWCSSYARRAYYKAREVQEVIGGATGEERNDSACRKSFFTNTHMKKICSGSYRENEDGTVQCAFPELPRNVQEMKQTSLYTDALWPCSVEDGKTVLHADVNCPGRHGEISQYASLSDLDAGTVEKCPYCSLALKIWVRWLRHPLQSRMVLSIIGKSFATRQKSIKRH